MRNLPKILVVSEVPFNWENGTGITLSNIFKGWDKNNIANVHTHKGNRSDDICSNYYKLNRRSYIIGHCLRVLMIPLLLKKSKIELSTVPLKENVKSFNDLMFLNFVAGFELSPLIITKDFWKWVKEFNPDLVYSMLGNGRIVKLTNIIASRFNIPVLSHFMDDWPKCIYSQNEWAGFARKKLDKELQKIFSRSKYGLCISDQMSREYTQRYKVPFTTVLNCVDDDFFGNPQNQNTEMQPIVFVFSGGLHLNRWKSLIEVAEVIDDLNKNGFSTELHIYCPEVNRASFSGYFSHLSSVYFKGSVSSTQVPEILCSASVLVHVESFEEHIIKFTQFSLSTKIPQYMASHRPILAYGPSQLASIQHIVNNNAGYAINSNDKDEMRKKIQALVENQELRLSLANNGYIFAKENHSQSKTHERLRSVLLACTNIR